MKVCKLAIAIAWAIHFGAVRAEPIDQAALAARLSPVVQGRLTTYEAGARRGDYQAMRNLAFTWSTDAVAEQAEAAVVGCAWYAAILDVHRAKASVGDQSNKDIYCSRLTIDQARRAGSVLIQVRQQIAATASKG